MEFNFELFPVLTTDDNPRTGAKVLRLLASIRDTRSMGKAAAANGLSQRHGWTLIRSWEKALGQPLIVGARGNGSMLTPFAMRLLHAEWRFRQATAPALEAAMAEFAATLSEDDEEPIAMAIAQLQANKKGRGQ